MRIDEISEIEIDNDGKLRVKPSSEKFPQIYREALEVFWEASGSYLHSPAPREWSYSKWFTQILAAAKEQGCLLQLSQNTIWLNVPLHVKNEITLSTSV